MMPWQDISYQREHSDEALAQAVANAFGLSNLQIFVGDEFPLDDARRIDKKIVVITYYRGMGEFPFEIELVPLDLDLIPKPLEFEIHTRLAVSLNDTLLIEADNDAYFQRTIFDPHGIIRRVWIDEALFVNHFAYKLRE